MSTPNKEEILKRINEMKSVCADGRKEIVSLVEAIIGQKLENNPVVIKPGCVLVGSSGYRPVLLAKAWWDDRWYGIGCEDGYKVFSNWDGITEAAVRDHIRRGEYRPKGQ